MSTINPNLRTNSVANRGGLKAISNRNISNIQGTNKNIIRKSALTTATNNTNNNNNKKIALSQSTNTLINVGTNNNSKLNQTKSISNNILKKPLASVNENENIDVKKVDDSKLCTRKSKIPKFSSPAKQTTQTKQLKRDINATIKSTNATTTTTTTVESKVSAKTLLNEMNENINNNDLIKFSSFILPDHVEDIDINDHTNVLLAPGFSNDIYMYLYHLEEKFKLKSNFLEIQQTMNHKMRARLVDWIIAVHHKFKLLPETLYLSIAIMDRFLEKVSVVKDKVQLVGLTAFFIACKYEEIYPPEISDFIKVCDVYTKNDILKMEKTILKTIDFNLSYPLPLHFLRRYSKAALADQEIHTLAKYLMELGLVEYECSSWKPSLLAAASLYLTLNILACDDTKTQWTDTLAFYTNYKENELQPYVSILSKILISTKNSKLQTVYKKYSNVKLMSISESPKLICDYVIEMSEKCI